MRKIFGILSVIATLLLTACSQNNRVVVEIPELDSATAYIVYADPDMINARTQQEVAKAEIQQGKCTFNLDSLEMKDKIKECTVTIVNEDKQFGANLPMPVEKGKTITLKITGVNDYLAKKSVLKVSYSGSKYAEDFSDFWQKVNDYFAQMTKNGNKAETMQKQVDLYKSFSKKYPESGFVYSVLISEMMLLQDNDNPIIKYCEEISRTDNSKNVWKNYLAAAYKDRIIRQTTASTLVFTAQDKDGNTVTERDIKTGKLTFIDFWASWCGPCKESIPQLKKLYNKYHSSGLEMVSISVDMNPNDWLKFIEKNPFEWQSLIGNGNELTQRYNFQYIPHVIIADADGKIVKTGRDLNELDEFIANYLE